LAEEKPVALIKTSDTGRIFDVDNMLRVMWYNANLWPSTIEIDVPLMTDHIKAAWEARTSGQTFMRILRRRISDMARQVGKSGRQVGKSGLDVAGTSGAYGTECVRSCRRRTRPHADQRH
jgi:hypothetical protein